MNYKNFIVFNLSLDETGTMDDDDIMIIPFWMFHDSSSLDDSSLLIQCNLDCIIEKPSVDDDSLLLQNRQRSVRVPPPRPSRCFDYIQVSLFVKHKNFLCFLFKLSNGLRINCIDYPVNDRTVFQARVFDCKVKPF